MSRHRRKRSRRLRLREMRAVHLLLSACPLNWVYCGRCFNISLTDDTTGVETRFPKRIVGLYRSPDGNLMIMEVSPR